MGEAKKRGSFEERLQGATVKKTSYHKHLREMTEHKARSDAMAHAVKSTILQNEIPVSAPTRHFHTTNVAAVAGLATVGARSRTPQPIVVQNLAIKNLKDPKNVYRKSNSAGTRPAQEVLVFPEGGEGVPEGSPLPGDPGLEGRVPVQLPERQQQGDVPERGVHAPVQLREDHRTDPGDVQHPDGSAVCDGDGDQA